MVTDHYTYRVTWSPEDGEFVGLCVEFPSLSWLADNQEGAFNGIRGLVSRCIADMKSNNEPVPEALADRPYSGRFMLRVPPEVHRALVIQAAEENVSLNRLVSARLAMGTSPDRRGDKDPEYASPVAGAESVGSQMRQAFVGFRALWTEKGRGALCFVVFQGDQVVWTDVQGYASFDQAVELINRLRSECDDVLVAIDKPIISPDMAGMRSVERVADSFMRQFHSVLSPAYRMTANRSGGLAPIRRFISNVEPCLDYEHAKSAGGCDNPVHLIEVYPALALPALEPAFMEERRDGRRSPARYRPTAHHFDHEDRELVCSAISSHADKLGLRELSHWVHPGNPDDEIVDAAICLLIALQWRYCGEEYGMEVLGNLETGYMVTPTSPETRKVLRRASGKVSRHSS